MELNRRAFFTMVAACGAALGLPKLAKASDRTIGYGAYINGRDVYGSGGRHYYVDISAGRDSDSNDGSRMKPFRTIGHAIAKAQSRDVVYIKAGRYISTALLLLTALASPAFAQQDCTPPQFTVNSNDIDQLSGWLSKAGTLRINIRVRNETGTIDGGDSNFDAGFWSKPKLPAGVYDVRSRALGCWEYSAPQYISIAGPQDVEEARNPAAPSCLFLCDEFGNDPSVNPPNPPEAGLLNPGDVNDPSLNPPNPVEPPSGTPQGPPSGQPQQPPATCTPIVNPDDPSDIWHPCPVVGQ